MKKMLNKIIALLILIELAGINILADAVYANNLLIESAQSSSDGIVFQANINNTNNTIADIEGENNLNINLSLKGDGFLKDVKILLNGNNYQIAKTADEINHTLMGNNEITNVTKIIKSIDENEVYLKEIDKGEELKIVLPIKFVKNDYATRENFETDSTITLVSTYINGKNEESQEIREIKQHLKWSIKAEEEVSQKIVRYLKYDNRTMVSFEVTDRIKDNKLPVQSKEINIQIPTVNNQNPETITVVGEGLNYEEKDGVLKVTKNYESKQLGEFDWNSENKFTVTYLYNTQADINKIITSAYAKAITILGDVLEGKTINNEFESNAEVGSIVQFDTEMPEELSKGYIYTNLNRDENKLDTTFNVNHKINIGLADLTDKVVLEEEGVFFNNSDLTQTADVTNYIKTTKVGVKTEEIIKTLGEDGTVTVRDSNLKEIGVLNKENTELDVESNNLVFETSKPQKEGLINIYELKNIIGDNSFSVEDLLDIKSLTIKSKITGYNNSIIVTNDEEIANTELKEPVSNASVDINTENLSTVTPNENVVINVVLNTTDVSDALYIDPTVRINFPEEITSITPKSAKIIYDDQLVIDQIRTEGRSLIFNLKGIQNKYNTLNTTKGTLLQIVTDLEVNRLSPSNITKITVDYTNEFTSETKTIDKDISIVAPYGIITTNQIDIDDKSIITIDDEIDPLIVDNNGDSKELKVTGCFINNIGAKAEFLNVLGRIPSAGNKTIGGEDLKSTINTRIITPIEVEGFDNYKVLYSDNVSEDLNGKGWTEEATTESKSFKIIIPNGANNGAVGKFNYSVIVPENLGYEKSCKENFGVFYNINSEDGSKDYFTESKVLGIETGIEPSIKTGITAVDTNEGFIINNNDEVKEGQSISYRVKVVNTGSEEINDVAISANLPEGLTLLVPEFNGKMQQFKELTSKILYQEVGKLAGGESQTYEFTTRVDGQLTQNEKQAGKGKKLTVGLGVSADILGDEAKTMTYTVKNTPGYFGLNLSSDITGTIEVNQEINYSVNYTNANNDDKTNTKLKIQLPNDVIYSEIDSKYQNSVGYNKNDNTVTVDLGKVKGNSKGTINIKAINKNNNSEKLSTRAELTCDGINEEIKSNIVEFFTETSSNVISASQSSNKNILKDSEEIEFYTDIVNDGINTKVIEYIDEISNQLGVLEYKVTSNGVLLHEGKTNYINEKISVPPYATVRVYVRAKAYPLDEGKEISVVNNPIIILSDGSTKEVNQQSLLIQSSTTKESIDEAINTVSDNQKKIEKNLTINGKVWSETLANGVRDIYDQPVNNLTMALYNADTNMAVLDNSGKEVTTETNEYGKYEFNNVKPGNYYVLGLYNDQLYEITRYREENIDETLNSDFVQAMLDNIDVAATEVINVNDSNVNDIDLGLLKKEQFDLSINQTIDKINISTDNGTRTLNYDDNIANIELTSKELEDSTLVIEYNVKIKNEGDIAGYAKSILNYIPAGMTFNSQMNPDWYQTKDGVLHCVSLANEIIQPDDSRDIKLILTKKNGNSSIGLSRGRAEIGTTYNAKGLNEISALSAKYESEESNVSSSNIVIIKKNNVKAISVISISIALIGLIGLTGYEIKKQFIDKMYKIDNLEQ